MMYRILHRCLIFRLRYARTAKGGSVTFRTQQDFNVAWLKISFSESEPLRRSSIADCGDVNSADQDDIDGT